MLLTFNIIVSILSPPHSFISGLKLSFSSNPSHCSLSFLFQVWLHGFPGLFTDTSEHVRFLLFSFSVLSGPRLEGDWLQPIVGSRETESCSGGELIAWTSPWQHRALLWSHCGQNPLGAVHHHGVLRGWRPRFVHQEDKGISVRIKPSAYHFVWKLKPHLMCLLSNLWPVLSTTNYLFIVR